MYVYKPMKGHNLMQAIARVNRVFPEKEGGLIVDYVGIAQALKQAMQDYTNRDKKQFGDPDIQKTAKVKFQEKLEICRDLLHGFDYTGFFDGSDPERARIIRGGLNFLLAPDKTDKQKDYIKESQLLHNALTLCRSLITQHEKQEVALMDAIRVLLQRFTQNHGPVTKQDINERIAALIEQSIQSTGVINLFETKREFSLFDEGFLEELRKMKEKNLAVQLLEKLVKERIRQFERTNIVQSQKFSELMNQALSNYLKGMLTNEEVIEELLKMAAEIKKTEEEGNELGLNVEEKAFYDALTSPEGIRDAYSNDEFIALTKELTEQLRKNRTIDWNKKESARAKMRVLVKRLLKKYKYPPEGQEQALNTVMAQCNKWADEEENLLPSVSVSNEKRKVVGRNKAVEIQLKPTGSMLDDVNNDDDVRRLVHNMMELYEGTTIMNIVLECQREFQEKYFSMGTNDWRHLIRDYVREVTERPELREDEVFRFVMAG
jgi:type I restriction enzyme R subunit